MAGHSKWANIQHRKSRQDAKKGKEFTKAAKEIILAAKNGGDPASNARLRTAIAAAKEVNLPKDKIDAAIRKGTGEDAGGDLFEIAYEGYGPGGVAILVQVASDNKNRIVAEVRHILSRNGGAMGEAPPLLGAIATVARRQRQDADAGRRRQRGLSHPGQRGRAILYRSASARGSDRLRQGAGRQPRRHRRAALAIGSKGLGDPCLV